MGAYRTNGGIDDSGKNVDDGPDNIDDFEKDVKAEGITDGGQEVILLQEALDGGWCVEDPDIKPLPKDGAV